LGLSPFCRQVANAFFFKYAGPTKFHLEVATVEGERLSDSALLADQPYRDLSR